MYNILVQTPESTDLLAYILNDPGNFLNIPTWTVTGYTNYDVDLNGTVQYTGPSPDTPLILQNIFLDPQNFLNLNTWSIEERLPEN